MPTRSKTRAEAMSLTLWARRRRSSSDTGPPWLRALTSMTPQGNAMRHGYRCTPPGPAGAVHRIGPHRGGLWRRSSPPVCQSLRSPPGTGQRADLLREQGQVRRRLSDRLGQGPRAVSPTGKICGGGDRMPQATSAARLSWTGPHSRTRAKACSVSRARVTRG